jgi:glyoxylase-like metal-dependent hydrolase (beta-lactamase superfamily II)
MARGDATRLPDAAGYEVWLLCVGALDFEPGMILPDRPATTPANALLLRRHGRTLLVDAGSGPADVLWPGADRLEEALATAGAAVADVDELLLTHLDFDHAGGALAGEWPDALRPAFPRALVSAVDYRVLRPDEPADWDVATRVFDLYEAGGTLQLVADGAEVAPRVRLVSAPGHRPGHCVLLLGEELVYGADVLHHEEHVEHPEWDARFDADTELALATRRAWIDRLLESGTPAAFAHIAGRGRVVAGPRWQPD